jgi:Methyltransferase domain
MTVHVSERIVEIPFVFANLRVPKGSIVVDLGCTESYLSLELANRGYKVLASDLRPYPFTHPNLTLLTGDFAAAPVAEKSVNAVVVVSTLEHIGLNAYRKGKRNECGPFARSEGSNRSEARRTVCRNGSLRNQRADEMVPRLRPEVAERLARWL